ncbi:MAG: serine/threonine protein kinase [Burkholderiaceae bacterium]
MSHLIDLDPPTPFSGLGPDCVLDALASVELQGDGRLIQLNSYENRVYQVFLDDGRVVVAKFYRPRRWSDEQILEEHAFVEQLASAELSVAPPVSMVVHRSASSVARGTLISPTLARIDTPQGSYRFSVTERLSGRVPELGDSESLHRMGSAIGRLHAVGQQSRFEFRQVLDTATLGLASRDWLLAEHVIPLEALAAWQAAADAVLAAIEATFARISLIRRLRLHGDCHLGNVLWAPSGPQFVDFDDTCTGPAVQDLWMLLSGDRTSMCWQLGTVLDGYLSFMDFDRRELQLIEPLRTLRMLRHSAWIAQRWSDPAFPAAFPWFSEPAYWHGQAANLRDQLAAMAAPPLAWP